MAIKTICFIYELPFEKSVCLLLLELLKIQNYIDKTLSKNWEDTVMDGFLRKKWCFSWFYASR